MVRSVADGCLTPALAARELLRRRRARESLIEFTRYTKPDFEDGPHHREIASKLEAVERGEITRLLIEAPPCRSLALAAPDHVAHVEHEPDRDQVQQPPQAAKETE